MHVCLDWVFFNSKTTEDINPFSFCFKKDIFQLYEVGVFCRMGADENHAQNRKFRRQGMAAESGSICSGNSLL